VQILKNGKFYTKLNASQGFGRALFGKVPSGKYNLTVRSCDEADKQIVYVPALVLPPRAKILKTNEFSAKFIPKGTILVLTVNKKPIKLKMPASGTAKFTVKTKTMKLGKNDVVLNVGGKVKITDTIIGTR
jgi:hypothetical protein